MGSRSTLSGLCATVLLFLAVSGRADAPALALMDSYEHAASYLPGASEADASWCFDFDGRPSFVAVTPQGVHVAGAVTGQAVVQKGMSFCGGPIDSQGRLECAVLVEMRSRETAFVLEVYSLDHGCSVGQARCDPDAFRLAVQLHRCPTPDVYPASNARSWSVPSRDDAGTFTLRIVFDGASRTITGYVADRIIGRAVLSWVSGPVSVRLFAEGGRRTSGSVDVLIKEVHVGWDGPSLP
ncbi:MAG: hypothetical protein AB7V19_07735 [Candidatus Bipolaricaulia bacterium]